MRIRSALTLVSSGLLAVGVLLAAPASAEDPPGRIITVAGSLQSELGCSGDWQP